MQDRWSKSRLGAVLLRLTTVLGVTSVVALAVMTPGQAVPALGTATITHRQMSEHHKSSPVTHTHANAARVAAQESTITLPNSDGRLEQFWRGSDCALWHIWELQPGGPWSGSASLGGCLTSDIGGTTNADGRLEIFGRGTDNALWHIWQTQPNCCWSGWASLGGVLTSGPYMGFTSDGGIIVDVVGTDGNWWETYQTKPNCCWSGWFPI